MRIHPLTGQIAHGIAGDGVYVDGDLVAPGGGQNGMPDWLGSSPIWCGQSGKPFQFVRGSQVGAWAGWTSAGGVVTSWGLVLPAAVLLDMAPDGTLLVGDNYQSGRGISAYKSGAAAPLWTVAAARPEMRFPYSQAAILDSQTASWTENQNGRMVLKGYGLPAGPRPPWNAMHPRLFRVNGEVWVVYLRGEDDRTIAHPWEDAGRGFSQPGFGFGPDASFDGDKLTIYWSEAAGERPGDIQQMPCDLSKIEGIPPLPSVTPIAPNVSSKLIVGAFLTDANTPGNLAGAESLSKAVICNLEQIGQVDPARLLGLFVDWGPGYTLAQRIEQCRPKADELKIPLFIYVDDRDYLSRLPEILAAVGDTPWIAFLQCYIDRRTTLVESVDEFAADVSAQARQLPVQWLAAVRCTTGLNTIPVDKVIASMNALVPIVSMPSCLGWSLWAWKRADGVTGVPALLPAAQAWLTGSPTLQPDQARAWAASLFEESPPMRDLTPAERATIDAYFANNPLPQYPGPGDAPESWQDANLRYAPNGAVYKLAQQMEFSHGPGWGQKRRGPGAATSNGTIALLDPSSGDKRYFHAYDLLQGASTGRPTLLGGNGSYYYVDDGQEWLAVPPFDHLGVVKPRTGRALWPAAVKHGVSGFDVAARVHGGDFSYYDLTAPLPLNVFVYTTIDHPPTFRLGRSFTEGLVQTETLLKKLTADNRQAMFIMVCGPHTQNNGPKPTRAEMLDMIRQEVALFSRYPKAVLALSMGNELYQGFEPPELLDPTFWAEVEALIPLNFPFTIGQVSESVVFGPGSFAVMHPDRGKGSAEALQILADAQARTGLTVVAREPARIEAGGSGQSRGDIAFVREELDNAKRLDLPYFLHLAAGRGSYVPAMDDVQHQALAMLKAEAAVVTPPVTPPPPPPPTDGLTTLGEEARASSIKIAYRTLLDRDPDPVGVKEYTDRLLSGWTVQQMEEHIRASAEYKAKHGESG